MSAVGTLVWREWARFYRQRSRIVGSLAMPVFFWALLGTGLQAAFPGSNEYLKFFFPGNLILTVMFTSIFSCISIIEDRNEGFLQSVLVSPLRSPSIVLGKILGGGLIAFLQGCLFLFLAPLAGFSLEFVPFLWALVSLAVLSLAMTALGFVFAWRLDSVQGFHAVMNLVLFPLWLLSGAFFPIERAPSFVRPLAALNPMTYGLSSIRSSLEGNISSETVLIPVLVVLAYASLFFALSVWAVGKVKELKTA